MKISIDFAKVSGKIKAMHGTGQPPLNRASTKYIDKLFTAPEARRIAADLPRTGRLM